MNKLTTRCFRISFNKHKTKVIVFGAKEEWLKISAQLYSMMLKTTKQARSLDVIINSNLNINSHIKSGMVSAQYYLGNLSRVK